MSCRSINRARAKGEERRAIKATIFHLPWLHHRVHTSTGEDPSRYRQWAGLLAPGSTYKPRLPTGFSARSGRCGVRPRLQRRDRNGFAPFSLFFGSGSRFQIGTHVAPNRTRTNSVVKPLEVFQVDPRPWPYPPRRPVRVADMSLARYHKILGSTVRLECRKPIGAETGPLLDQDPAWFVTAHERSRKRRSMRSCGHAAGRTILLTVSRRSRVIILLFHQETELVVRSPVDVMR